MPAGQPRAAGFCRLSAKFGRRLKAGGGLAVLGHNRLEQRIRRLVTPLFDAPSFALVVGGTLTATLGHCGASACRDMAVELAQLMQGRFDPVRARSELARQVRLIGTDGLVRSDLVSTGDTEIDNATLALITRRSLGALATQHERQRRRRLARTDRARGVLLRMADLAPVAGLGGTLLSLATLAEAGIAGGGPAGAIGMAVLTTLYGLLLANGVALPLAGWIERRAQAEDQAREEVFGWLNAQVAKVEPRAACLSGRERAQ